MSTDKTRNQPALFPGQTVTINRQGHHQASKDLATAPCDFVSSL